MKEKYTLVNPYLVGKDIKTTFLGKSPMDAAENAWKALSKNMTGDVLAFKYTLKGGKKLHHFMV